ncbi:hypothetical protein Lesp02_46070 [Lentzea sp. NBRC 105346]|uniref:hypothetical protein n=1 Tax=Lentzea sp. NBRC 105346 TaxID=3032205 RepID=UPI0024A441D6|nr:hypothetical protein [Lentzea sp. NBRC 105346]GLZ32419.1 hypothetical protein Lesp02_46070 [Lentzea sp. NBRC 105346]
MFAKIATATVATGIALLAASTSASASPQITKTLVPGEQWCIGQYAYFQARGDGMATNQGAKFKLQYNGVTIPWTGSPGLVTNWAAEVRSSLGTFPGAGYYSACATNNGTMNTKVTLQIRTDGEFY